MIKNNFKILKKTHAYLQTILKAPVKFQKDRIKTVVGVTGSRYLLLIHFCSIRTQTMSKLKMQKSNKTLFQDSEKTTCISLGHLKSPCKVSKGSNRNCGRS